MQAEPLTIKQTATGYWVVQRGGVHLAGAMTREAAEAERDLLNRLRTRSDKRLARGRARAAGRRLSPRDARGGGMSRAGMRDA